MLFNSYIFLFVLLPLSLAGYYLLNHFRHDQVAKCWLVAASLFFYAYFNPWYLLTLGGSIVLNFLFGRLILSQPQESAGRCAAAVVAILLNLGVLFCFKYYDFFVSNLNAWLAGDWPLLHLVLPLGISFFTFQQVSYIVDCRRGTAPRYPFWDYALFVSFFPQLVAGPIVLHSEMLPQFADPARKKFNRENFAKGMTALALGLMKKCLLADTFGAGVTWGYANIEGLGTGNAALVILAYTLQIYFDFSGYCDMATGIGLLFNIELPQNFHSPYRALTVADFWKRWHMTLTRFFTAYLYIPLGGNRRGKWRTYGNVFLVFLVSGLWHGANWTFILWGALHGAAVVFCRAAGSWLKRIPRLLLWPLTFLFLNCTWVFFRAESIAQGWALLREFFSLQFLHLDVRLFNAMALPELTAVRRLLGQNLRFNTIVILAFFLCALLGAVFLRNTNERLADFRPSAPLALLSAGLILWSIVSLTGVSVFLYFNF